MSLKMELQNRQELRLVMTPQLQQAIKLLQLSRLELTELLHQELQENPMLEISEEQEKPPDAIEDPDDGFDNLENSPANEAESAPAEEPDPSAADVQAEAEVGDFGSVDDMEKMYGSPEWDAYLNENYEGEGSGRDYGGEAPNYENFVAGSETLIDHLAMQLRVIDLTRKELEIATYLLGNINDDGYLEITTEEAIEKLRPSLPEITADDVEDMVWLIQTLDPLGIGARNLAECLLIQIDYLKPEDKNIRRIIADTFDLFEKQDYKAISRKLGLSLDQVYNAMRFISELDPRPGRQYTGEASNYIVPDIYVHKIGNEYHVVLNDDGLPRLKISNLYRRYLKGDRKVNAQEKEFMQEKIRSATWLIKSIHQRQRTIYRVAESIVKFQQDFLERGVNYLKPMILRDVAEDIGIHESTASRVCTNKYIHTPQGIFELRYFFNSSISSESGDDLASESVKNRIKEMLAEEDPKKPLSDQAITEALIASGINIARRTVSKYREALGILSSSKRKKRF